MITELDAEEITDRLVRAIIGSGLADDPLPVPEGAPSCPAHRALAQECAIASSVLLTNRNHALPLGPDVASIAVIGPSGADALYTVGGSAAVTLDPDRVVTPLHGIQHRAGEQRTVVSAQGSLGDVPLPTVPASALQVPDGSGPGVLVTYRNSDDELTEQVVLPTVDLVVPFEDLGVRWPATWHALLSPARTGSHRVSLELGGRATVRINGQAVLQGARELPVFMQGPAYPLQATVDLIAGEAVELEIEFAVGPAIAVPHLGLGPMLRLGWQQPDRLLDDAVEAAGAADAAIVLVNMVSGEGMDRDSLQLPGDQDELVRRVAAVNGRTIVVLNTPGAVLLPWRDNVAATLQVWYPGETFGSALAAILFGDAEPGGRLPVTFPRRQQDLPGGNREPGSAISKVNYAADQGIGYRSTTIRAQRAAFPFGFGLSYVPSSCELVAIDANGALRLHVSASTTARQRTVHVVQAYVDLECQGDWELAAVARLDLPPDGSTTTDMEIPLSSFSRWDPDRQARRTVNGIHRIRLAQHSADDSGPVVTVEIADSVFKPISWSVSHPPTEHHPATLDNRQPPPSQPGDPTEIRDLHAQL